MEDMSIFCASFLALYPPVLHRFCHLGLPRLLRFARTLRVFGPRSSWWSWVVTLCAHKDSIPDPQK